MNDLEIWKEIKGKVKNHKEIVSKLGEKFDIYIEN